jgi:hypothetical protein
MKEKLKILLLLKLGLMEEKYIKCYLNKVSKIKWIRKWGYQQKE